LVLGAGSSRNLVALMSAPALAEAANGIAMNRNPLPRNAVAKKRSSCSPIRSRIAAMNQRNAKPAAGTRSSRSQLGRVSDA